MEEKLGIVLEGLKGHRTVTEICRSNGIRPPQFYRWKERFLEAGKQGLNRASGLKEMDRLREEIDRLQKLVGKQAMQIEQLKKMREMIGNR